MRRKKKNNLNRMQEDISERHKTCCTADVAEEREWVKPPLVLNLHSQGVLNLHSQGVDVSPLTSLELVVQGEEL